jgi:hypothetical protein
VTITLKTDTKRKRDALIRAEIDKMLALSDAERNKQYGTEGWKLLVRRGLENA